MDIFAVKTLFEANLTALGFEKVEVDDRPAGISLEVWLYERYDGTQTRVDVAGVAGSDRQFFNVWMSVVDNAVAMNLDAMGNGFIHESVYGTEECTFLLAVLSKATF